jgi:3-methylfumaryl-CoA hydratase
MFAGGRVEFLKPLRVGEEIRRVSTIGNVTPKEGKSGSLVFVLLRHEISGPDGIAIVEEQDIVYREDPAPGAPPPPPRPQRQFGSAPSNPTRFFCSVIRR